MGDLEVSLVDGEARRHPPLAVARPGIGAFGEGGLHRFQVVVEHRLEQLLGSRGMFAAGPLRGAAGGRQGEYE